MLRSKMNDSDIFLFSPNNGTLLGDGYNISGGQGGGWDPVPAPGREGEPSPADLEHLMEQLNTTRLVVQRVVVPLVVGFGVLGNLVNIVVLTRRWMKSSTNCYLTALAVCDILYLVFALSMSFKHYPSIKDAPHFIRYKMPFGRPLVDTFSNTGVWLTLTFTMERYIGVCHPMKGKRWCTPQRARYVIAAVCVSAALVTFPEFFEYVVVSVPDLADNNRTRPELRMTEFGSSPSYRLGYYYINQGLFTLLPLVLLLVFNSLLIRAVYTAARQRRAMAKVAVVKAAGGSGRGGGGGGGQHRAHSDQQKITIMLIMVVIVFLLCQLPSAVQKMYTVYLQVSGDPPQASVIKLTISANIFNLLVMINAASNFVLYSCFSTKFRRTFRRLFCNCLPGHRRSIPEILFTDMTATTNPSPPEESRAHLLQRTGGTPGQQKNHPHHHHPHHHHYWGANKTPSASSSAAASGASQDCGGGRTAHHPRPPGGAGSSPAKNGYLEVMQGGKSVDGYRDCGGSGGGGGHLNSSAL